VFTLTFPDNGKWEFNALDGSPQAGKIARCVDRAGNALRFNYDGSGRLTEIIDTLERSYRLSYDSLGHIQALTDFNGRSVTYSYYRARDPSGNDGDLRSMTSPAVTGTPNGNDFPSAKPLFTLIPQNRPSTARIICFFPSKIRKARRRTDSFTSIGKRILNSCT